MKSDGLYYKTYVYDYEGEHYICIKCKNTFATSYETVMCSFCPNCGIKLTREWTKRNKRWYCESKIRWMDIYILRGYWERLGFSIASECKYSHKWIKFSRYYLFNGNSLSKSKQVINDVKKYAESPHHFKLVINRSDGSVKEIYGDELKLNPWINIEYKQEYPKNTISCSGISPSCLLDFK